MSLQKHGFCSAALLSVLATALLAQIPAAQAPAAQAPAAPPAAAKAPVAQPPAAATAPTPAPAQAPQNPNFRVQVDLVTTDVLVRDEKGNFVSDLKKDDFDVYEDGILQDISSMTVVTGGRVTNALLPPPPPPPEGIILPPTRPRTDTSGRIFVFFVDDQHLSFHNTGRVRELFQKMAKELVHDGDLFGIVSSGPSSIQVQMTYDKSRLQDAIKKMTGNELSPDDIINGTSGPGGPSEIRYRARVAFSTVEETLNNLEQVHNRRKALVYVSDGYDFIPFQAARLGLMDPSSPFAQNTMMQTQNSLAAQQAQQCGGTAPNPTSSANTLAATQQEEFADADLARELWDLTRTANRANVTIYTLDPRGLVGPLSDIDDNVDPQQWAEFIRKSQDSLRVLAEETGGVAIVNMNDFSKGIRRIDAETSDYYVLGFYSKNPDPLKKNRRLEVKVRRPGVQLIFRKEYSIKPLPTPVSSTKK
jgi:VWFA-related protein